MFASSADSVENRSDTQVCPACPTDDASPASGEEMTDAVTVDSNRFEMQRDPGAGDGGAEGDGAQGPTVSDGTPPPRNPDAARGAGAVGGDAGPRCHRCGRPGRFVRHQTQARLVRRARWGPLYQIELVPGHKRHHRDPRSGCDLELTRDALRVPALGPKTPDLLDYFRVDQGFKCHAFVIGTLLTSAPPGGGQFCCRKGVTITVALHEVQCSCRGEMTPVGRLWTDPRWRESASFEYRVTSAG